MTSPTTHGQGDPTSGARTLHPPVAVRPELVLLALVLLPPVELVVGGGAVPGGVVPAQMPSRVGVVEPGIGALPTKPSVSP